ncbi:hypothetical protein [Planomonospora venezuelensis]|uniref:Uncharacterized protein n=1 Tax=Planomonospora venezuelensis TaxID=1999 RepID=A0A841DD65_PLAVE|nr:hypothetical protein [Planomonospora venezuelensis]MBB5968020.1 hypothetical protein [Planomonospora venezuelensis]GIN05563.1 hypothetical protein Pve01_72210 [Planomonospora venezuelensis]
MYSVELDPIAQQQAEALPTTAITAFLELRAALELQPGSGEPLAANNPKANMLTHTFGSAGMITYFVVEHLRLVYIVRVHWLG